MVLSRSYVWAIRGITQASVSKINALESSSRKRGKFPGERRWIYAGAADEALRGAGFLVLGCEAGANEL